MPGRKKVEILVSFECDSQDDIDTVLGGIDQCVTDCIPSSWAVWSEVVEEEEL